MEEGAAGGGGLVVREGEAGAGKAVGGGTEFCRGTDPMSLRAERQR